MKKDEKMSIEDMTAYMRIVPERKASYAEFPDTMNDEIKEYLGKQGINALYTHQTEMFEKAGRGENTVITTSTASGKRWHFFFLSCRRYWKIHSQGRFSSIRRKRWRVISTVHCSRYWNISEKGRFRQESMTEIRCPQSAAASERVRILY